nr:type I secretion system permease/ATPase [Azospirillum oleiclasticum]
MGFCLLFSCAINLLFLAPTLYMLQVYDRVIASGNINTLIALTVAVTIAYAAQSTLDAVRGRLLLRSGNLFNENLRERVFQAEMADAVTRRGPAVGTGARDLDQVRAFLGGPAMMAMMDAPWVPLFVAVIALLHPLLAVALVCGTAALLLLAVLNEALIAGPTRTGNAESAEAQTFFDAVMRNAQVVCAMGMSDALTARWNDRRDRATAALTGAADRGGAVSALVKFLRLFLQSFVLGLGAWLAIAQEMSAGSMFAAVFLLARALAPVELAVGSWRSIVLARQAWRRLDELLQRHPEPPAAMTIPQPRGAVAVTQLGWLPDGVEQPVIRGVEFMLEPGEALGVVGPSGAGKSTLLRLLVGIHRPTAGSVRIDGADLAAWNRTQLGGLIGYLPQEVELLAGSIRDNIARFQDAPPEAVVAAAEAAGCHAMIMGLPKGYDTEVGDGGMILSGGQRQRVGLSRALFGAPRLIVLDEPNANLDAAGEEQLMDSLDALKASGATLVIAAQRPRVLETVDRILVLRNGQPDIIGERAAVLARLMRPAAPVPTLPGATVVSLKGGTG